MSVAEAGGTSEFRATGSPAAVTACASARPSSLTAVTSWYLSRIVSSPFGPGETGLADLVEHTDGHLALVGHRIVGEHRADLQGRSDRRQPVRFECGDDHGIAHRETVPLELVNVRHSV